MHFIYHVSSALVAFSGNARRFVEDDHNGNVSWILEESPHTLKIFNNGYSVSVFFQCNSFLNCFSFFRCAKAVSETCNAVAAGFKQGGIRFWIRSQIVPVPSQILSQTFTCVPSRLSANTHHKEGTDCTTLAFHR